MDFLYKEGYVLSELKIELFKWHKVKLVYYHDGINHRFRGTIDDKVLLDLNDMGQYNFKYMNLLSRSLTPIGHLRNIRIAGRSMTIV